MGILCKDNMPFALASSAIGQVSQCTCCESYHVTIGNITMRMERKHLLSLTQMIIEALEVKSSTDRHYQHNGIINQA